MFSSINRIIAVVASVFVFSSSFAQDQNYTFTIDECMQFAMENNQDVLNASLEIGKQEKIVKETLSEGLPQVDAFIDLRNNFQVPTSFIPAAFFDENAPADEFVPVRFSTQYNGNASVSLKQMVFYGSYFVGVQAAKTFTELSTKEHVLTKIDIAEAVTKGFYSVLINEAAFDLVDKNYNRLDSLLRETKIMYETGFAEKIDVNRIQVQFNNIQNSKREAQNIIEINYKMLKYQMGMPINTQLNLVGELSDMGDQINNQEYASFQYDDRVEYSILQTRESLAEYDLKNTTVQYLPRIDFYLTGGANAGTGTYGTLLSTDNWYGLGYFGLNMSIPIFDGLYKSAKIQQKRITLSQIQNSFSQMKNSIDLQIQTAEITLDNSIRNLRQQELNMALSKEVYDVTKLKYQEGIGSNIELIEADGTYKEAQNYYFNAMYDVLISKVDLDKARGVLYQ